MFGLPFDVNNCAYQRFVALGEEHFTTLVWTRGEQPVMVSLYDISTGDAFTVAVLDSIEARDAHALIAVRTDGTLSGYGPYAGNADAATQAASLALADATIAASLAVPLWHPGAGSLPPDDVWRPIGDREIPAVERTCEQPTTMLLLLDNARRRLAAIGPFATRAAALQFEPSSFPGAEVDCRVLAMNGDLPDPLTVDNEPEKDA